MPVVGLKALRLEASNLGYLFTAMAIGSVLLYFWAAFPPFSLARILAEVLADQGRSQFRTAETEKYPHVTYFLNGGDEHEHRGEVRILVPSPRNVKTYDLAPEMSAAELADRACEAIDSGGFGFAVINFANPDMVGHTGVIPAVIRAVEAADTGLGRVLAAVERQGGVALVTADHGNAEEMLTPEGLPHTAHTTNPVPLVITDSAVRLRDAVETPRGLRIVARLGPIATAR
jgi:2,3-bisphosphoglycerate-independent phosphoglycerate mutase